MYMVLFIYDACVIKLISDAYVDVFLDLSGASRIISCKNKRKPENTCYKTHENTLLQNTCTQVWSSQYA